MRPIQAGEVDYVFKCAVLGGSFVEEGTGDDFKFKPAAAPTPWRNQLPVDAMVVRFPN